MGFGWLVGVTPVGRLGNTKIKIKIKIRQLPGGAGVRERQGRAGGGWGCDMFVLDGSVLGGYVGPARLLVVWLVW